MHYRNGREAKNGDVVVSIPIYGYGVPTCGVLFGAKGTSSDCNGSIAQVNGGLPVAADLKTCLHIDDIFACSQTMEDVSKLPPPPSATP